MLALWGTTQPSASQLIELLLEGERDPADPSFDVEADFWEEIGRGEARYIVLYDNNEPSAIFFVGYPVD